MYPASMTICLQPFSHTRHPLKLMNVCTCVISTEADSRIVCAVETPAALLVAQQGPKKRLYRLAPARTWPKVIALRRSFFLLFALCLLTLPSFAQAPEDTLSQREIDNLRDAAFVPSDRIVVFEQILDDRQKQVDTLLARRKGHTDFAGEMHDLLEQMGGIADELNDNLDEYSRRHRDVRKVLPKLIQATERWSTSLRAPADSEAYGVVRRIALDNIKDTRELATTLQTELDAYFKAHPEAEKDEKKRNNDPHAVRNGESPQ